MLQSGNVTSYTVSELFRDSQQGEIRIYSLPQQQQQNNLLPNPQQQHQKNWRAIC